MLSEALNSPRLRPVPFRPARPSTSLIANHPTDPTKPCETATKNQTLSILLIALTLLLLTPSQATLPQQTRPTRTITPTLANNTPPPLTRTAHSLQSTIQTSPIVGQNVQVTSDPFSEPQNEPAIAVDPANHTILAAGANDYRLSAQGFDAWAGLYLSKDDGHTWTNTLLPGYPGGPSSAISGFQAGSDPAMAFNKQGALYYSGIAFNRDRFGNGVDGTVFVYRTTDLGHTNQTTIVARGSSTVFNDKPYVTADTTNSTFAGRVYVSWTKFSGNTPSIMFALSSNGGSTFSTPIIISDTTNVQGSIPAVGPGGAVYVAWLDNGNNQLKIRKSVNGGVSFSAPVVAASIVQVPSPFPRSSFRTDSFPTLAVDPANGNIYIAWNDYRNGNGDIFFTRSTNQAASFSTPVKINDDTGTNDKFFPWIASALGRVSAIWYDRRLDPANHNMDIFYTDSTDGGATFSRNTRITDTSSDPNVQFNGQFIGDYIGLTITTREAHPVWTDTRNLNQDIFTSNVAIGPVHDIAVTAVNAPRRISYTAIKANPLNITVSISNNGNVAENVTVQISLQNTGVQENQTVAIQPGTALQVPFNLTTQTLAKGNYTIVAKALPVPGETNTANNMMLGGTLQVRFPGDVNGDRRVDILDVAIVAFDFGKNCQSPGYSYAADLNNDCRIDILDIAIAAFYFGTVDP